ncbi:MAG: hypothetical protein H6686_06240 [Fibrobacteria bacterium]|nr:hypothetical protein [Fibrobacteria bacterium]
MKRFLLLVCVASILAIVAGIGRILVPSRDSARDASSTGVESVSEEDLEMPEPPSVPEDGSEEGEDEDIPSSLRNLISWSLWRSGAQNWQPAFLGRRGGHPRVRQEDGLWVVDFRDLPISAIGSEDGSSLEEGVRFLVSGSALCDQGAGLRVPADLRDRLDGLESATCSESQARTHVREWFRTQLGQELQARNSTFRDGRAGTIRVSCPENEQIERLGLLWLAQPDTLIFEGCAIPEGEQEILHELGSRAMVFQDMDMESLLLFKLGKSKVRSLMVRGGSLRFLQLPPHCGKLGVECTEDGYSFPEEADVVLEDLPICDDQSMTNLRAYGYEIIQPRCTGFPFQLFADKARQDLEWEALPKEGEDQDTATFLSDLTLMDPEDTVYSIPTDVERDFCGESVRPDEPYMTLRRHVGRTWIEEGYRTGASIHVRLPSGRRIRAGMTRSELKTLLGTPTLEAGGFIAWGGWDHCHGGLPFAYRAHFDENGRLDSWFQESRECEGGC